MTREVYLPPRMQTLILELGGGEICFTNIEKPDVVNPFGAPLYEEDEP
jgi:hypothetical protein